MLWVLMFMSWDLAQPFRYRFVYKPDSSIDNRYTNNTITILYTIEEILNIWLFIKKLPVTRHKGLIVIRHTDSSLVSDGR